TRAGPSGQTSACRFAGRRQACHRAGMAWVLADRLGMWSCRRSSSFGSPCALPAAHTSSDQMAHWWMGVATRPRYVRHRESNARRNLSV
ncbi:MAG: hypothetical protein AVDCRST_MAG93-3591, partial [uncultured Chloroflexia bacterium]